MSEQPIIKEPIAWAFVAEHYPDYSSSDLIAYADDLHKIINGEITGEAAVRWYETFKQDKGAAACEYYRVTMEIYEQAIESFMQKQQHQTTEPKNPAAGKRWFVVKLAAPGNPDMRQFADVAETRYAECANMALAIKACETYISHNNLGAGNWGDGAGNVWHPTLGLIAKIMYNGKAYKLDGRGNINFDNAKVWGTKELDELAENFF